MKTGLTIAFWGLWFAAAWKLLTVWIFQGIIQGYSFMTDGVAPWEYYAGSLTAVGLAVAATFAAWVRKKLD
jgi:hypothetical protein